MTGKVGKAQTNQAEAGAGRNGRTAVLVALFGVIIWTQAESIGSIASALGVPAFFLGLALWFIDLGVRGNKGRIVLNRFLRAGEDLFIGWGIWTAFALGDAVHGITSLRDLQIGVAAVLFVAAVLAWLVGLFRGRKGIADEPAPGAWLFSAWQPLAATGALAIIGGSVIMHVSLVLAGAAITLVSLFGWFFVELPVDSKKAGVERGDRAYA